MLVDIYKLNCALIEESDDLEEIGSYDIFSDFYEGSCFVDKELAGLRCIMEGLGYTLPSKIIKEMPGNSFVMIYDAITREPLLRLQLTQ